MPLFTTSDYPFDIFTLFLLSHYKLLVILCIKYMFTIPVDVVNEGPVLRTIFTVNDSATLTGADDVASIHSTVNT